MFDCDHQDNAVGPFNIDYINIYCGVQDGSSKAFVALIIFSWAAFLTNLLGNTAANYFSPTLASICTKIGIPYDIAGMTFLAFGNGAPDIFSSLTAFSGENDVLVGLGSLLGGSMFVTTVVVGTIAIVSPCEVSPRNFTRDLLFHVLAVSSITFVAIHSQIGSSFAYVLFFMYIAYVVVCLSTSWFDRTYPPPSASPPPNEIPLTNIGGLQTAFWHKQTPATTPTTTTTTTSGVTSATSSLKPTSTHSTNSQNAPMHLLSSVPSSSSSSSSSSSASSSYKFLILDEEEEEDGGGGGGGNESKSSRPSRASGEDIDSAGKVTINLSGGLISPAFSGTIIEDYVPAGGGGGGPEGEDEGQYHRVNADDADADDDEEDEENVCGDEESDGITLSHQSTLKHSLLPSPKRLKKMGIRRKSQLNSRSNARSIQYANAIHALYWQQVFLRRRLKRSLVSADWWNYPIGFKILSILEFPFMVARDFTIPTIDPEMWSKCHAVLQPQFASLFLLFTTGNLKSHFLHIPMIVVALLAGAVPSLSVYLLTHHSRPPKNKPFLATWMSIAFVICIAWIYLFAKELVTCLTAIGTIFNISPAYLGLTVLAWGNSTGDFFSNMAVARQGLGEVAVAGCYGGPIFNILIGLSISIGYACFRDYPKTLNISLDASCIVSLCFLYLTLMSTFIIVRSRGFQLERPLGYYLIMMYVAYTIVQFALLVFGIDKDEDITR